MKARAPRSPKQPISVLSRRLSPVQLAKAIEERDASIAKRAYQLFEQRGFIHGFDLKDWTHAEKELFTPLALEIREKAGTYAIRAKVPGLSTRSLEVGVEHFHLVIKGKQIGGSRQNNGSERSLDRKTKAPQIYKVVELPSEVHPETVQVRLSTGVLQVEVLKKTTQQHAQTDAA